MDELQAQVLLEESTRARILSSWDGPTEAEVASYGEKSLGYHWIHYASALYFSTLNSFISISTIVSSGITTAATASSMSPGEYSRTGLMVTFSVLTTLSAISTILASVSRFLKAGENYEKHLNTAIQFSNMANEIKMEMSFKPEDRTHSKEFVEKLYSEYNKILSDAPTPPTHIVERFKKEVIEKNKSDIAIPEIANGYFRTFKHLQNAYI